MQVTETKTEGLLHEFNIVISAAEIEENVTSRLTELSKTARLPGFRPGKVPVSLLRKQYGPSVMGEVLEKTVNESSQSALNERELNPAVQPKIEITKFDEGADLEYTMAVEVLPSIEPMDFSKLKLERMVVKTDEEEVTKTLERLASAHKSSEPLKTKRKSKSGDIAIIDFVGKVDGEEFAGGKAEGYSLELGSGSFIPGFEDQLTGAKAGDHVEVKVQFPEEYGAEELAGKDAVFEVDVKELHEAVPAPIDDELAKKMGLEGLDQLKASISEEQERELKEVSRQHLKRELLDILDDSHSFDIPQGLVDNEIDNIWNQYQQQMAHAKEHGHDMGEDADKSEEEIKEEYREISERRVRLGLLLAEVGKVNNIQVSQDDINRGMMDEARRYPGQEQQVLEYFRSNPDAVQSLTAPILEEKVVDFIVELAKVSDKEVTADELLKEPEEKKPAKKKAAAKKKAPAKKAPAKKAAPKKKAAKKDD